MFEKVAGLTSKTLYVVTVGAVALCLAWLCLANLPLWAAVAVFCLAMPLVAMVVSPVTACAALILGLLAGATATGVQAARQARHGG